MHREKKSKIWMKNLILSFLALKNEFLLSENLDMNENFSLQ